jgi:uncharacterized membrane protein
MNRRLAPLLSTFVVALAVGAANGQEKPPATSLPDIAKRNPPGLATPKESGSELAAKVRQLFVAKCLPCHGARPRAPSGDFGYVLDLPRVAAEPKYVIPFKPEESELWQLVRDDKMPTELSGKGPLRHEEKELVRGWIAGGAPAPPPTDLLALEPAPPPGKSLEAELPRGDFLAWLGRLHVVAVHFPIALAILAAGADLWFWLRGVKGLHPAVRFCILLSVPAAATAAALGWLLAWSGFGTSPAKALSLFYHEWLGTLAAIWLAGVALVAERSWRRGRQTWLARLLLLAGAIIVGVTAHLGGTLVYGEGFLSW